MAADDIAVLLVEADHKLADLVARYLGGYSIRVTTLRDPSRLAEALAWDAYTCVVYVSPLEVDAGVRDACERAGVALLRIVPVSAREVLARILAVAGKPAST